DGALDDAAAASGEGGAADEAPAVAGALLVTCKPAFCRTNFAFASDWPTKFGMTKACGGAACATSRLILGADTPLAFGGGFWDNPSWGAPPATGKSATVPTSSPRRRMFISAARWLSPKTLGICTRCGPRLAATRISQPRRTRVPGSGTWDRIFPSV